MVYLCLLNCIRWGNLSLLQMVMKTMNRCIWMVGMVQRQSGIMLYDKK